MPSRFPQRYEKPGFILTALLLLWLASSSQPLTLQAEMELNYGLRHNSVRSVMQDEKGRTFLGTESGLVVLEAHDAYLDSIIKQTENLPIVSLNKLGNLLFIGTVANGLKIFDLAHQRQVLHPILDSIRYVRRIRKIGNVLYVAANASSWKVTVNDKGLLLQKIHRSTKKGFFTDFLTYNGEIYAYDLKAEFHSRVFKLKGNQAFSCSFPKGFPPNPIYSFLTGYGNDSVMVNTGDGFYNIVHKNGSASLVHLTDSVAKLNYPVWEIANTGKKMFLALGQQFQLKMGLTYEVGVNSIKDIRNDFFAQSLYYNPTHDALWVGTYNRGLFVWPKVSLSNRLPAHPRKIEWVIKKEKDAYFFHDKFHVYEWKHGLQPVKLWDKRINDSLKKEITYVNYRNDTLGIMRTNSVILFSKSGKLIDTYPFYPNQFGHFTIKGDSIFFFTIHNTGVYALHKTTKKGTFLKDISIGVISKPYRNGFVFFSDEKGFYFHDTITKSLQSPLTKIQEYEIIGNQLWVLIAGHVIKYRIDVDEGKLEELQNITYTDILGDFIPNWIRVSSGKLFIGNNKGLLQLDTSSAKPLWHSYLGNYKTNLNPEVYHDTLFMIQDQYVEKHPLVQPYSTAELRGFNMQLDQQDELFARFPVSLKLKHTDYFLQRYALKRLELEMPDGKVQTLFTLGNEFAFPSGLTAGKYNATLYVNGIEVTHLDFKVTVPLLQNPFFYAVLAALIIIVFYQLFQYRAKKQELERSMLENRLQLLKKNLDPHFIFNSLNLTYMLLLQENNKEAIDSIIRFSDLHRYFLEMINQKEIPLTEELKFIKNYLELEQKRVYLDAPFSYAISEYDENASRIMIPPMILHPLVENAVKYCGYDPVKSTEAKIQIGLIITSQQAVIRIENSLGTTVSADNVGFKRGVEIVRETISIYNKMGQHRIDFHPNLPSKHFQPGFLCELIIKMH